MQLNKNIIRICALYLLFSLCFHIGYKPFVVKGDSMRPTLIDGQKLFINKIFFSIISPDRFDGIIVKDKKDGGFLAKRIIGMPGESIQIIDGDIFINGSMLKDKFSNLKISFLLVESGGKPLRNWETGEIITENENTKRITLKEDEYWVIGDNREVSWYGIVKLKDIIGKI